MRDSILESLAKDKYLCDYPIIVDERLAVWEAIIIAIYKNL